jgi:hypothetical protein
LNVHDGEWYGANAGSTGGNYFNTGYFLGSANSGFDVPHKFYIDRVRVATSNQWGLV